MNELITDYFLVLSDITLMPFVRHIHGFWLNQCEKIWHSFMFQIIFSELNLAGILRQKATFYFLSGPISFCIDIHFGASIVLWTLLLQNLLFGLPTQNPLDLKQRGYHITPFSIVPFQLLASRFSWSIHSGEY